MIRKTANEKRKELKRLLMSEGCTAVPGVYDALGANLAEKAGFEAVYLGSFATAVSTLGQPDVGSVTMTEMATHAKNIANSVNIPLIVDAENGFYHAANIWRTVREMELSGAAAIHVEDHEFGKHTDLPPVALDTDKMCNKIKAALDARLDPDFMIIARTDIAWITMDLDEMIARANAYLEAGADAVFLAFDPSLITKEMCDRIKGPVIIAGGERATVAQESSIGLNMSFYWPMLVDAAYYAMKDALKIFKETQDYSKLGKYIVSEDDLYKEVPMDEFTERVKKYL